MTRATVVGVFDTPGSAYEAVRALREAGFGERQVGVVLRDDQGRVDRKTLSSTDSTHSQWEEGMGVGAATGALGGLGLGLAVAAGTIPAIGPVIAGGALAALLASAGTGALIGSVLGGLIGLGVPEDEASYYDEQFRSGKTLVTVEAGEREAEAEEIIHRQSGTTRSPAAV